MSIGKETSDAARAALSAAYPQSPILRNGLTPAEQAELDLRKAQVERTARVIEENDIMHKALLHVLRNRMVLADSIGGGLYLAPTAKSPRDALLNTEPMVLQMLFRAVREVELEAEHAG